MDRPHADLTATAPSLSDPELSAIAALQRLARRWPRSLTLVSYDGSLSVIRSADLGAIADGNGPEREDLILANIDGIPNDGGGW